MVTENFAMGVGNIYFQNGVVVVDFTGPSPTEKDDKGRPTMEIRHRLVMTPAAMIQTLRGLKATADKLVEVGFLKRREGADTPELPEGGGGQGDEVIQ
ncbi:MAG: hypothetical protein PVG03_13090 [Desulfarculaceae bacterium]|jgi:hypothetical protein